MGSGVSTQTGRRTFGSFFNQYRNTGPPSLINWLIWNPEKTKQCVLFHNWREAIYMASARYCFSQTRTSLNSGTYLDPVIPDMGLWVCISIFERLYWDCTVHQPCSSLCHRALQYRVFVGLCPSPLGTTPGLSNHAVCEILTSGQALPFSSDTELSC